MIFTGKIKMSLLYFKNRSEEHEYMDDFQSDKKKLFNTIKQFWLINLLFSRSRSLIKKYIVPEIKNNQNKIWNFLDIGVGGGDIVFWADNFFKKNNYKVKIFCLDYDKRIIEYLKEEIKRRKLKNITIIFDSVSNLSKHGKFDFVFSNHFLHHFNDNEIVKIIKIINRATKNIFVINDMTRSKGIYFFHSIFASAFLKKSFTLCDGLVSIKKGFIPKEIASIAKKTDKNIYSGKKFPARVFLFRKK